MNRRSSGLFPVFVGLFIAAVVGFIVWALIQEMTEPDSGRIYSRSYHPPYVSSVCTKDTGCSITSHPECYQVKYWNEAEKDDGDACVAPQDWDKYQVGTQYP